MSLGDEAAFCPRDFSENCKMAKVETLQFYVAVMLWVERRTSDQEVAGLTPAWVLLPQQP